MRQQTTPIYFPLEIKVRDLNARLYTALKCVTENTPVIIGHYHEIDSILVPKERNNFVYFDKGRPPRKGAYNFIREHGGVLALLHEEGGIFADIVEEPKVFYHPWNTEPCALVFLWGEAQCEPIFTSFPELDQSKFIVTGNPRFDLRKPQFDKAYLSMPLKGRPFGKYVLINTVFEYANNYNLRDTYDFFDAIFSQLDDSAQAVYQTKIDKLEYQKKLLPLFCDGIEALAQAFPHNDFIIRPHPVESPTYYQNRFRDQKNVLVSKEGDVQEWIVGAAAVIHHDCTTAIEAFINKKPVVSFMPAFDERLTQKIPVAISEHVFDRSDLVASIRNVLNGNRDKLQLETTSNREIVLEETIANIRHNAAESIAKHLQDLCATAQFPPRTTPYPFKHSLLRRSLYHTREFFMHPKRYISTPSNLQRSKFAGVSLNEISTRIRLFRMSDSKMPNVTVQQIGKNSFSIRKK